jgi:hypothetical protein
MHSAHTSHGGDEVLDEQFEVFGILQSVLEKATGRELGIMGVKGVIAFNERQSE